MKITKSLPRSKERGDAELGLAIVAVLAIVFLFGVFPLISEFLDAKKYEACIRSHPPLECSANTSDE